MQRSLHRILYLHNASVFKPSPWTTWDLLIFFPFHKENNGFSAISKHWFSVLKNTSITIYTNSQSFPDFSSLDLRLKWSPGFYIIRKTGESKNKNRGINKWERRELRVTCKMLSTRVTKRAATGWRWIGSTPLRCERDVPIWSLWEIVRACEKRDRESSGDCEYPN